MWMAVDAAHLAMIEGFDYGDDVALAEKIRDDDSVVSVDSVGPSSHKRALVRDHNFAMRGGMCHNSGEQLFVGVRKLDARGVWMRCSRCGRGS